MTGDTTWLCGESGSCIVCVINEFTNSLASKSCLRKISGSLILVAVEVICHDEVLSLHVLVTDYELGFVVGLCVRGIVGEYSAVFP